MDELIAKLTAVIGRATDRYSEVQYTGDDETLDALQATIGELTELLDTAHHQQQANQ